MGARAAIHPGQTTGGGTHAAQFSRWGLRPAMHPGQTACDETRAAQFSRWGLGRRSIPPDRVALRRSSLRFGRNTPGPVLPVGLLPHAPCQPDPHRENWASPASALTRVPPPAVHRAASRRSSLRFSRNTSGIPPSRALSAGPPPGGLAPPGELGLAALGAHATLPTDCQARRERGVRGGRPPWYLAHARGAETRGSGAV